MDVTGATYPKTYHPTLRYSGTTNSGGQKECSNRLEMLCTPRYESRSKKTKVDKITNDRLPSSEKHL
jgi:hypothetical protein